MSIADEIYCHVQFPNLGNCFRFIYEYFRGILHT